MHIEPLAPRTLFSVGVDPSFGDDGVVALPPQSSAGTTSLAIGGATYLWQYTLGQGSGIVKYDADGQIDTTWGGDGKANISEPVSALAYDKRTGKLYAAGEYGAGKGFFLARIDAAGELDGSYGTGGVFKYQAPVAADTQHDFVVEKIIPLARGEAVLAVHRESLFSTETEAGERNEDVAVMRIRNNGTRSPAFGNRGVVTLLSGQSDVLDPIRRDDDNGVFVNFGDVSARADGGFDVAFIRQSGVRLRDGLTANRNEAVDGGLSVKYRSLSATGVIDASTAASWTLEPDTGADGGYAPLLVHNTGNGGVRFLGNALSFPNRQDGLVGFSLTPGVRPAAVTVVANVPEGVAAVTRSTDGYYFVTQNGNDVITKFNSRFEVFKSFGRRGSASPGLDAIKFVAPDVAGGALAISDDAIVRLV